MSVSVCVFELFYWIFANYNGVENVWSADEGNVHDKRIMYDNMGWADGANTTAVSLLLTAEAAHDYSLSSAQSVYLSRGGLRTFLHDGEYTAKHASVPHGPPKP